MKKVFFSCLILFFTSMVFADNSLSQKTCDAIHQCRDHYASFQCENLKTIPGMGDKVTSCSLDEVQEDARDQFGKIIESCGLSIADSVKQLLVGLSQIELGPGHMIETTLMANAVCKGELGYDFNEAQQIQNDRYIETGVVTHLRQDGEMNKFRRCQRKMFSKLANYKPLNLPSLQELKKMIDLAYKGALCLRPEARAEFVCPTLASMVGGGAVGFALRRAILRAALAETLTPDLNEYFAELEASANKDKEKLSVRHQEDLVAATHSVAANEAIDKAGIDRKSLVYGKLDSDVGKSAHAWDRNFMLPSKRNNDFILALQGRGPHGHLFQKIFDKHYRGRSLLPRDQTPAEIRRVLADRNVNTPNPIKNYLHEIPGMGNALDDLLAGKISEVEFEKRIMANLGHNGPHEGFWGFFGETILGQFTLRPGIPNEGRFFAGTIFDDGPNNRGVYAPRYRLPVSVEGFFHTVVDRISQGTRGGITKLFSEIGGNALEKKPNIRLGELTIPTPDKNGLGVLRSLLTTNPTNTVAQMNKIIQGLDNPNRRPQFSPAQTQALRDYTVTAKKRLEDQNRFIAENMRVRGKPDPHTIDLEYRDSVGNQVVETITLNTPADDAVEMMNRFMLAEERLNGDPISGLGGRKPRPPGSSLPVLGAAGGATYHVAQYCERSPAPSTPGEKRRAARH
ncbi:MAG: hypothetical protein AAF203_01650 [Pseudomonadota bacterium]